MESTPERELSRAEPKPTILMLIPNLVYRLYKSHFNHHFNFIIAQDSHLPLSQFLAGGNAAGVTAALTSNTIPITSEILRHLPSLRCIVNTSAGTDHIDLHECRRRRIAVANSADCYSDDCADMALALLLDVLRKISAADRFVRSAQWENNPEYLLGNRLSGKRLGIVGMGNIGSRIATRLTAFGCSVSYTSRKQKKSVCYPFHSDVTELAAKVDVLVLCCALTEETRGMINKDVLYALGKDGVIINIARGGVVDEEELVRCLVEGEIAGAGLDVFEDEPHVPNHLLGLNNVVLSPHLAYATEQSYQKLCHHVTANFQAFFSGNPLLSPVGVAQD